MIILLIVLTLNFRIGGGGMSLNACRSKPAGAAFSVVEFINFLKTRLPDRGDHHLANAIAAIDRKGVAPVIDQDHF